jgi:inosine/xanthosine triphosphatase
MAGVRPERVAVGSTNPAKLAAVEAVVNSLLPGAVVAGVEVASPVAEQPRGDAETLRGAERRARLALAASGAGLGVGIESGIGEVEGEIYAFTWVAVVDVGDAVGRGCSARMHLPPAVAAALAAGATLEGAMRAALDAEPALGRDRGAMGFITAGAVTRADATIQALHFAFARFARPGLYRS